MKRLLWITDAHLDHLSDVMEDAWFEKLANTKADMLLLGGDTANARIFSRMLGRIQEVFPKKVVLVAGNHDYYHTSISDFRAKLAGLQRSVVLCGHTHSDGNWKNGNITCHTAGSAYGRIDHSGMITLGKTVTFRRTDR